MKEKSTYKRSFSEQSKRKMSASALARSARQRLALQEKIDIELEKIWHELANKKSDNSSPRKVTLAHIARRLGIHTQTLHKSQNKNIADHIKNWISELTTPARTLAPKPRRSANSVVDEWKRKYNDLLAVQCLWETDLHEALAKVDEVQRENAKQMETIKVLTSELKLLRTRFGIVR